MKSYQINLTILGNENDQQNFYNSILMLAKGFRLEISGSDFHQHKDTLQPVIINIPEQRTPEYKPPKKALTTKETASYLGRSLPTIYRMVDQKKLPYYRIGHRLMFKLNELEQWLDTQKHK